MIYFVIGTKAQLIKMAPIMVEMQRRGIAYRYYSTGQHQATMGEIHQEFGIRKPDAYLVRESDVITILGALRWLARTIGKILRRDRALFEQSKTGLVVVHGDTLSTLVGALVGRRNWCRIAHVESGLRSQRLLDPFPEEVIRRIVFRLSDVLFCPGEWAVRNVPSKNKTVIDTHANTLADAVRLSLGHGEKRRQGPDARKDPFGVVSIHRTENIMTRARVARFVEIMEKVSEIHPTLVVMHKPTRKALSRAGYLEGIERNSRIEVTPRLSYFAFLSVLNEASFVISDGGSNQEECSYLGKPILLLRKGTERKEGLGANCVVSGNDERTILEFVRNFREYERKSGSANVCPSALVVNYLQQWQQWR